MYQTNVLGTKGPRKMTVRLGLHRGRRLPLGHGLLTLHRGCLHCKLRHGLIHSAQPVHKAPMFTSPHLTLPTPSHHQVVLPKLDATGQRPLAVSPRGDHDSLLGQ